MTSRPPGTADATNRLVQRAYTLAGRNAFLGTASAAYGALLVILRGRPSVGVDAGVFLSVAGRLVHGDHLYRDVWDNKDPLFFYADAAALWVGGWTGPFLLDILWVALAAASVVLLLRKLTAPPIAAAAGFVVYPLLLTGQWYYAGYSMLAALALAPFAAWLWARGTAAASGVVVALGMLFKINLALVLLAAPVALLAMGIPARRDARGALRFLGGLGATLAAVVAALAARGELVPYFHMLRDNVSYANDVLVANGRLGGIHGHIRVVETATRHAHLVIGVFLAVAAVAVWAVIRRRRPGGSGPLGVVAALFLVVGGATAVTLALTTAWNHHVQMLAYPGVLLVLFVVAALGAAARSSPLRLGAQLAAAVGAVVLLGAASPAAAGGSESAWVHGAHSQTAAALEVVRAKRFPAAATVSYAHLGQNDEEAHAAFLGGGWALACARFHQYPWTPGATLSGIVRCIEKRRPDLLLVTSSLSDRAGVPSTWHEFVVTAQELVRREYERVYFLRHAHGTVAVWQLRA